MDNVSSVLRPTSVKAKVGFMTEFSIFPRHGENSKLRTGSQAFPARIPSPCGVPCS